MIQKIMNLKIINKTKLISKNNKYDSISKSPEKVNFDLQIIKSKLYL